MPRELRCIECDAVAEVDGRTMAELRAAGRVIGWRRETIEGTRYRVDVCPLHARPRPLRRWQLGLR